jgi:hypothetical protein
MEILIGKMMVSPGIFWLRSALAWVCQYPIYMLKGLNHREIQIDFMFRLQLMPELAET